MITSEGRLHLKRYLARQVGTIGGAVAFGVSNAAEAQEDRHLGMEIGRSDVTLVTFDFVTNRLIFKGILAAESVGDIYEVGLWSLSSDSTAGNFGSKQLVDFSSDEGWTTTSNFYEGFGRVGRESLRLSPAASLNEIATRSGISTDLSGYSGDDKFIFAFNPTTNFVSQISLRFKTNSSNYYEYNTYTPSTGYKVLSFSKSLATPVGNPLWSDITSIEVAVTSTSGGTGTVYFDALRIEDVNRFNPDYVLVARVVLGSPIVKERGRQLEVEYSLVIDA